MIQDVLVIHQSYTDSLLTACISFVSKYRVVDSEGNPFNIPDKDVKYCMTCPNSPGQAEKLYNEFCKAQEAPIESIQSEIDVTPELLQMAWEEAAEESEEESTSRNLTPASFIELVHAHAASAMEKYLAWKYLQSEQAHIFFKDIKSHGRVVSFKAKTRKAVDNAKDVSDTCHGNPQLCPLKIERFYILSFSYTGVL